MYHTHVHVPYTCTCTIHMHVPYTCTCTIHMYMYHTHVHVPYTCTCTIHMYMYHTHVHVCVAGNFGGQKLSKMPYYVYQLKKNYAVGHNSAKGPAIRYVSRLVRCRMMCTYKSVPISSFLVFPRWKTFIISVCLRMSSGRSPGKSNIWLNCGFTSFSTVFDSHTCSFEGKRNTSTYGLHGKVLEPFMTTGRL